jgi:polar amino acid transport system substrate-binding protein
VFYEPLAVAIDKSAPADPTSFVAAVDQIVGEMHDDGTLTEFSKKWYNGADLTVQQ